MMTCNFYWLGAVAAMVFVGVFMMPFYYGSKARSVPEYLKLRFDEKTRGLNAISFAVMTIFQSGMSMYVLAKMMQLLLGWDFNVSLFISAAVVLVYLTLGGLTSAIYNEVLQFFLIALGFLPLVCLGSVRGGRLDGAEGAVGRRMPCRSTIRRTRGPASGRTWETRPEPDARGVVRDGGGLGIRAGLRLLVYRLPGRAAGDGGGVDVGRAAHAGNRHDPQDSHSRHRHRSRE